jgi:ketol-acid reductoisomerase
MQITILGYGTQGRAQARNLAASGATVRIAVRRRSPQLALAIADGMATTADIAQATAESTVLALLIPDDAQPDVWKSIERHVKPGTTIIFAHGYNLHYATIQPRADLDILLIAPMAPGDELLRRYAAGTPIDLAVAVVQDASGHAKQTLETYSHLLTNGKHVVIPTTVAEETETDLFTEQVLLCGGLSHLMHAAYQTMIDAGYSEHMAHVSVMAETQNLARLFADHGLDDSFQRISSTARYGALTRGPRIVPQAVREEMRVILGEIRDGRFHQERSANAPSPTPPWKETRSP